jgi:lipopolysaccharide heptosyltransferase I
VAHFSGSTADLSHQSFTRILLVKPSSLGDVVHALPVLHGLRVRYPQAKIDWLIATTFAPLLEGHEELDELILFDRRRFASVGRSPRVTGEFLQFVRDLKARRYDLVIDLQGLFRAGFLTWMSGARVRIGFRSAREGAWIFYTHQIRTDDDMHAVDRNYGVAGLLGFADVPVQFNLSLPDAASVQARRLLPEVGLHGGQRLIAVAPGGRWETKVWRPERFTEVIDRLQEDGKARCLLVGGPDEVRLCGRIAAPCRTPPVNLAGRTSLPQLAAVIGLADLVICHDSAVSHLAVALKRPLVCLVGPTNPNRTGPYRRIEDVVQLRLDCMPCYQRRLQQCRYDHRCMKDLGVDKVVAAAEWSLGQPAGSLA